MINNHSYSTVQCSLFPGFYNLSNNITACFSLQYMCTVSVRLDVRSLGIGPCMVNTAQKLLISYHLENICILCLHPHLRICLLI